MTEPIWIRDDVVIAIHQRQIAEHGGIDGIRDTSLLKSALTKPLNLYHYKTPKPGLAELAASYAYGIARNHAFIDGNKRTSLVVCQLFLRLNGTSLNASESDKYHIFMALASSELTEIELANWISRHI